jgi:uncharacterized protein YqhQ
MSQTVTTSESAEVEKPTPTNVGGQAVIEGVMMRAPGSLSVVCRRANGSLVLRERTVPVSKSPLVKIPIVRGAYTFFSAIKIGHQALQWSGRIMEADFREQEAADKAGATTPQPKSKPKSVPGASKLSLMALMQASMTAASSDEDELEAEASKEKAQANASEATKPSKPKTKEVVEYVVEEAPPTSIVMTVLPVLFALGLYVAAPQLAAEGIARLLGLDKDLYPVTHPLLQALTGAAKLTIIITLFLALRQVRDFRRMFEYHGAEHMSISTYEAQKPLLLSNARNVSALHARCGTTFIIMVAFVSVVLFSALGSVMPTIQAPRALQAVIFFFMKLPLLPVIAGITLEIQKVLAKYCTTGPLQVLLWPGFLVQKITTAKPDDDQLEVALASLRSALANATAVLPEEHPDRTFESYDNLVSHPAYAEMAGGEASA